MTSHFFKFSQLSGRGPRAWMLAGIVFSLGLLLQPNAALAGNLIPRVSGFLPGALTTGTTQPVTVIGSGFVPTTEVILESRALATTYVDSTHVIAQVPVPQLAVGRLIVEVYNPGPGGGWGTVFQLPIAKIAMYLTATGPDGTDTGTARLGGTIQMSQTVTGSASTAVRWWISGWGSISSTGVYTAPTFMPPKTLVTVHAALLKDSAIVSTYNMSLVNPIPVVSAHGGVNPYHVETGATQPITITGSGFVPGTTAIFNGNPVASTFIDYNHVTVHVPVPDAATGKLYLQMSNPGPVGGLGTVFAVAVTPNSLALTANGFEGVNTGTAGLATTVNMSAAVTGSALTAVNWSHTGAGTISGAGVYTAPSVMPGNQQVTIKASLASNPAITATYSFTLINPIPVIDNTSPVEIPAGTTSAVTLYGTRFVQGTVITVNGNAVPTAYQSPTSVVAHVTVPGGSSGYLTIRGANPGPGGGTGGLFQQAIASPTSATAAARILDQTTFGPTSASIQHVQQAGISSWLAEQFNAQQTVFPNIGKTFPWWCNDASYCYESDWWKDVLTGNDQLRQRVAFALSELFVVSSDEITGQGLPPYSNMLATDAFSNWYTIMHDVTVSPAMGIYLNMLNSYRPSGNLIANENFARENMQLFNLGLYLLNQDGSQQLDLKGHPIPTYSQGQVEAFARAFTGWTYANSNGSTPGDFTGTPNFTHPLVAVQHWHDENPKSLLNLQNPSSFVNGTVLPAGQTAEQDLNGALTNVFNHPNLPPFVSKQLIQHLVKSNPSHAYIARVADVFVDNGNGVRGDMKAVLTAILTDPEARSGDTGLAENDGHLREPMLWLASVMRGLGYVNVDPNAYYNWLSFDTRDLQEEPLSSPSVFNFYPPSYVIPGTTLNAPEFGLENTASVTDRMSLADSLSSNNIFHFNADLTSTSPLGRLASNPGSLVDQLGRIFMHSKMDPNLRAAIVDEISGIPSIPVRVRVATYLVITAAQYKISE